MGIALDLPPPLGRFSIFTVLSLQISEHAVFLYSLGLLSLWWGGGASLIAQMLMNPPAMQETWV